MNRTPSMGGSYGCMANDGACGYQSVNIHISLQQKLKHRLNISTIYQFIIETMIISI